MNRNRKKKSGNHINPQLILMITAIAQLLSAIVELLNKLLD